MSKRPNIETALKLVSSRYELVHAAAKRVEQLMQQGEDIFLRDKVKGELVKKTFQAIEDIANGKVRIIRGEDGESS
ncbi:MAG: DNA-directed RNA polymerase subunit omega [Hydrogenobacter thermophilus]|uniref:DNA-directed RNA polymerase subunit omega n=1 Tax=Hydrogenobacter thermophilus (strain DSM 6534 / IAM 12695 / TK-6) TaxID=608538 RepID=D3DI03_HYDTT|nr:DNA-directed RNA polymerase subunit omega [Hydrogenobacter thermophilus]ADO45388.1 DNA-directed RNA polymerase, omega subunit [Hydrogenobacter thermophilus TK-6]MCS7284677.1 DNA-directed RNA polymerase subunit omega [Hydrogenobacter thermophilus]BAI69455.1 DNA-directed RNA polymerase omega subunit [Hydrogenobacter thermophilus TK-6]GBC88426.1 DNA-directed RNA polymerase subunit omega [bacterium HR13]